MPSYIYIYFFLEQRFSIYILVLVSMEYATNNQHALACFFICSLKCSVIFVIVSDAGESPKQSCQVIKMH